MKKQNPQKLKLQREALKTLSSHLNRVAGGGDTDTGDDTTSSDWTGTFTLSSRGTV